jgi:hypothetical protein
MIGSLTHTVSNTVRCPESMEKAQLKTEFMITTGFPVKYLAPVVIGESIKHSSRCTKENRLNCPFESGNLNNLDSYSNFT